MLGFYLTDVHLHSLSFPFLLGTEGQFKFMLSPVSFCFDMGSMVRIWTVNVL